MSATLKIKNADMRNLWLNATGLAVQPTGTLNVAGIIKDLGFVQLDTIQNVSRAHHHIIWSRNQNYREPMLDNLLAAKETIFEHFTHDASIIPLEFYPMWTRQFDRLKNWLDGTKRYRELMAHADIGLIKNRIEAEGPLSTHAFDSKKADRNKMWARPSHKLALDYLWYSGDLATSHRENFKKFYDLSERVIPEYYKNREMPDHDQVKWLCDNALQRLGFGTLKDIKNFWDATNKTEVEHWYQQNKNHLTPIKWQNADGNWLDALSPADIEHRLASLRKPTSRLRIINPFDPAVRDRVRLKNLFGFDYKIEIFVPAAKRKWGYYVYPILEGARFIGRIELKADRKNGILNVLNFWQENDINWSQEKFKKLDAELNRFARLASITEFSRPR